MWVFCLFVPFTLMGLLCFPPALPSRERVVLRCIWCKSRAQTTQACQQSATDSSNPSSQSSYPGRHYPKALAVTSCTETSTESALNRPGASILCVKQTSHIHLWSTWGSPLWMPSFSGVCKSPPRETREPISVKHHPRTRAHLPFLWWRHFLYFSHSHFKH